MDSPIHTNDSASATASEAEGSPSEGMESQGFASLSVIPQSFKMILLEDPMFSQIPKILI